MQCFRAFHTAEKRLEGIESLQMIRKWQVKRLGWRDAMWQARIDARLCGMAA